jgi:transcriptional regulator with XRE-family HTH domain
MAGKSPKPNAIESVRDKLREAAEQSGMSQQAIGEAMGFNASGARQAVSRILKADSDYDPRLSTLLAFAQAIKRRLSDIL